MDVKYLPQMADEDKRSYLFVGINRATCWVFVQIKTARSASSFLMALHKTCPIKIQKLLIDNSKEFTDRLFARRERELGGEHEFDRLCHALGIEHRTKPRTTKTNGMVERFNGRIADVLKNQSFQQRRGYGLDVVAACGSVQPSTAPVSPQKQNPDPDHERLVRFSSSSLL